MLKIMKKFKTAIEKSFRIFSELDINGDGELTCEEFIKGCMQDEALLNILNSGKDTKYIFHFH